jgi:hypothetical protein
MEAANTRHRIEELEAESLALQTLMIHLVSAFNALAPTVIRPLVLEAFENAAQEIAISDRSEIEDKRSVKAMGVLEQLRMALSDKDTAKTLI